MLPDAQALAREGGETRPPHFAFLALVASTSIGLFGLWFAHAIDGRSTVAIPPLAIVGATIAALAWKVVLDPTGRKRPITSSVTIVGAAACIAWAATESLSLECRGFASNAERSVAGTMVIWLASTFVGVVGLGVAKTLGASRARVVPIVRGVSAVVAVALVTLLVIGAMRLRFGLRDPQELYEALPVVGTIPPTREPGDFWNPIVGGGTGAFEGQIGDRRVVLHRATSPSDDALELETDRFAPFTNLKSPQAFSTAVSAQKPVVVRLDPEREAWILDDGRTRETFVRGLGLWRPTSAFRPEWRVPLPKSFVVEGAVGLAVALLIRASRPRSAALMRATSRRAGALGATGRLTFNDGDVLENMRGTPGPVIAFDARIFDDSGYRGARSRRTPRLFFGTLAGLDEALIAERAARDSLALAVASLAAAPLVGAAFAGVLW